MAEPFLIHMELGFANEGAGNLFSHSPTFYPYIHCRNPVSSDSQERPDQFDSKIGSLNFSFLLDLNLYLSYFTKTNNIGN